MPRPPRRAGRASRSHSVSFGALWPVSAGKNLCLIAGFKRLPISGVVLAIYVHLLVRPCVKAE